MTIWKPSKCEGILMYCEEILVSVTSETSPVSLNLFFSSPEDLLSFGSEYLWFSTKETLSVINSAEGQLSDSGEVVQFCSIEWIHNFLSIAPRTVQAAMGFMGVTAIKTESVRQVLSNAQPKSGIEILLAMAQLNCTWNILKHPQSSFRLKSSIPASNSSEGTKLLSVLKRLPENLLETDRPDSTTEIFSGLLLIHAFLDPSHECSQSIEGMGADGNGDYWHGIMHRREPDFGNAKYWFRRVGDHPCFVKLAETAHQLVQRYNDKELQEAVQILTSSGWDSIAAVDFFQKAHHPSQQESDWHAFAEELQLSEMLILLTHCCS